MSSFLCFICHNAVNSDMTEETREKYREVVGMNLCHDSHLCFICCHMVNKLWLFKSVCLKRSLEYPVLFSEKCTINLHRSDIETLILCSEEPCLPTSATHHYFRYNNENRDNSNDYVELEDENNYSIVNEQPYYSSETKEDAKVTEYEYNLDNLNDENNDCHDIAKDLFELDPVEDEVDIKEEEDRNDGEDVVEDGNDDDVYEEKDAGESETSKDISNSKNNETQDFNKILLTLEEQKTELEAQRRSKKYIEAEFKCYNCALGFLFKDSYQAHMMRHEESNGEYLCQLCTLRFASPAVLRAHKAGHRERHTCGQCGTNVRKSQRDTHARKCHSKERDKAACHLCGNVFQDASGLQQHLKRFHMSKTSNRTYPCSVCGKSYNNQAAVRCHMIKHIQRKFSCDQCAAQFSSPYTLTQHKKKHTNSSNEKEHMCVTCGVGYTTRKSLLAHIRTALQHQERVFECPICRRVCPNSRALSLHLSRIHSSNKEYECAQCNRKYTSRQGLIRHVREHATRAKTKMAQCHVCGKSFKSNSKLNRHIRQVCMKDKLEEELAAYQEHNTIL